MAKLLLDINKRIKLVEDVLRILADGYKLTMDGDDGIYGLRDLNGMRWRFHGYSKHGEKVYCYLSVDEHLFHLPNDKLAEYLTHEIRSLAASVLNYSGKPQKKKDPGYTKVLEVLENELGEISP